MQLYFSSRILCCRFARRVSRFSFIQQKPFNICDTARKFYSITVVSNRWHERGGKKVFEYLERFKYHAIKCLRFIHFFYVFCYRVSTPSSDLTSRENYAAYWNLTRWIDFVNLVELRYAFRFELYNMDAPPPSRACN